MTTGCFGAGLSFSAGFVIASAVEVFVAFFTGTSSGSDPDSSAAVVLVVARAARPVYRAITVSADSQASCSAVLTYPRFGVINLLLVLLFILVIGLVFRLLSHETGRISKGCRTTASSRVRTLLGFFVTTASRAYHNTTRPVSSAYLAVRSRLDVQLVWGPWRPLRPPPHSAQQLPSRALPSS